MRLAFLIYNYFPFGGQQRDFLRVLTACQSRGHDITIYTMKWEGERPENVRIILVPVKAMRNHTRYQRFSDWVNEQLTIEKFDGVIGFNKMPGLDVYFAADPCFAERAKTQRYSLYKYSARYRHFMKFERAVFAQGAKTQVMILSPTQRNDFSKHYSACVERLHDVPPGISEDRRATPDAAQRREKFRKELGFSEEHLVVLQIGSAGFVVKGVDRSLQAIAALPVDMQARTHYVLVGQDKQGRFKRQAKKLGIWDKCHFTGGREDIPNFLLAADLLLHPAYSESAGYVLLEATVAGLPVLTTDTCGYAFHITKAGSGIVCESPFQQEQLNLHLKEMLETLEDSSYKKNGIRYGQEQDLYLMPERVTDMIGSMLEQVGQISSSAESAV
jgi:UDP-glucose:(heptosyl)LPS alpha-1,3-glucosyltransferase